MIALDELTKVLHNASEYHFDLCYHSTYTGGLNHNEPYSTCEILAQRVMEALERSASNG